MPLGFTEGKYPKEFCSRRRGNLSPIVEATFKKQKVDESKVAKPRWCTVAKLLTKAKFL